jgi:hypothetical protein
MAETASDFQIVQGLKTQQHEYKKQLGEMLGRADDQVKKCRTGNMQPTNAAYIEGLRDGVKLAMDLLNELRT